MSHSGMTNVTFHVDTEQAKKTIQRKCSVSVASLPRYPLQLRTVSTIHPSAHTPSLSSAVTVSSDTSLSTLLTQTLLPHLPTTPHTLYDLTLSPTKPVTLTEETDDDVGENSVTLYSLGEDNSNTP